MRYGEGGIRTPDRGISPYNGLANRRLQPLGHLSSLWPNNLAARRRLWKGNLCHNCATKSRGHRGVEATLPHDQVPLEDEVTAPRLEGRFEDGREIRSHAEREETRRLALRLPRAQPDALPVPINPVPGELQGLRHTPARRFEELDHDAAVRGQLHEDRREVARVEEALSRVVQLGCWSGYGGLTRRRSSRRSRCCSRPRRRRRFSSRRATTVGCRRQPGRW